MSSVLDDNKRVVFFISGGSALEQEAKIITNLLKSSNLSKLSILPIDERFGKPNHINSNVASLKKLIGDINDLPIHDVLINEALDNTKNKYDSLVKDILDDDYISFALIGIGEDGHIAGILNNSPAETSSDLVEAYISEPFTRITLTKNAIKKIGNIYVSSFGQNKAPILTELFNTNTKKPMSMLKDFNNVKVYTDNVITGENL